MNKPFFSIVTDSYNRSKTIEKTIISVNNQTFKDYEYIIVDHDSKDGTADKIKKILKKIRNFRIIFKKKKFEKNEISRWNSPLIHTTGKYISVLEGDDFFEKDCLLSAHKILIKKAISIFVMPKYNVQKINSEFIINDSAIKRLRLQNFCPPPSETIFVAKNKFKKKYFYNEKCKWAGEYSLYEKILADADANVFISKTIKNAQVHRGVSYRKHSFIHLEDSINFLNKNKKFLNEIEITDVKKKILSSAFFIYYHQLLTMTIEKKLMKFMIVNLNENKYLFLGTFANSLKPLFRILARHLFGILIKNFK
jgi:glycosyltransferase involved in cell wall biosynthesis